MKFIKKVFPAVIVSLGMLSFTIQSCPAFKLLSAESQRVTAGIPGGSGSIEYTFKVVVKTSDKIHFDSVWINNKALPIKVVKGKVFTGEVQITQNDTLRLRASELIPMTGVRNVKSNGSQDPLSYIGYTKNDRKLFYVVKDIRIMPDQNMQ